MGLELVYRGEINNFYRNVYFPNLKFIERTDHFTIDDIVFPDIIFSKGVVLNQMSNKWMELLEKSGIISNTIIANDTNSLSKLGVDKERFSGRMIAVQDCIPIPLECIVRGYYVKESESWAPYINNECNMYGNVLPYDLKDSERLSKPIYTPSIKGDINKPDLNISFAETINVIKDFLIDKFQLDANEKLYIHSIAFTIATAIRDISIKAYSYAHDYAIKRNIIIADAKLEFGIIVEKETGKRKIVIISEAFTPDTCRFWSTDTYQIGTAQSSLDKQLIKRYIKKTYPNWYSSSKNKFPLLPINLLTEVSKTYWYILEKLFDKTFEEVTSQLAWDWKFIQENIFI